MSQATRPTGAVDGAVQVTALGAQRMSHVKIKSHLTPIKDD